MRFSEVRILIVTIVALAAILLPGVAFASENTDISTESQLREAAAAGGAYQLTDTMGSICTSFIIDPVASPQEPDVKIIPAKAVITKLTRTSKSIRVTIRSQKARKVTKYQIAYKKASAKSWTTKTTTSTSYTIKSLKKKTKYKVKARAYGSGRYGSWSSVKTIKTK